MRCEVVGFFSEESFFRKKSYHFASLVISTRLVRIVSLVGAAKN
jgi:hypothetical protein